MSAIENHLFDLLPRAHAGRLQAAAERVALQPMQILFEAGRPLRHAYFPLSGSVSLLTPVAGHADLEVSLVGREGMLGAHLVLGVAQAPLRARVQTAGVALCIAAPALRAALADGVALRQVLQLYVYVQAAQLARSAGCQRHHLIGQRMARWLLMSQDRAQAAGFHVTHEVLAGLLGVRRVSITVSANELQRQGLIGYRRGEMAVLDRAGLEAAACSCYAADCVSYADRLGPFSTGSVDSRQAGLHHARLG